MQKIDNFEVISDIKQYINQIFRKNSFYTKIKNKIIRDEITKDTFLEIPNSHIVSFQRCIFENKALLNRKNLEIDQCIFLEEVKIQQIPNTFGRLNFQNKVLIQFKESNVNFSSLLNGKKFEKTLEISSYAININRDNHEFFRFSKISILIFQDGNLSIENIKANDLEIKGVKRIKEINLYNSEIKNIFIGDVENIQKIKLHSIYNLKSTYLRDLACEKIDINGLEDDKNRILLSDLEINYFVFHSSYAASLKLLRLKKNSNSEIKINGGFYESLIFEDCNIKTLNLFFVMLYSNSTLQISETKIEKILWKVYTHGEPILNFKNSYFNDISIYDRLFFDKSSIFNPRSKFSYGFFGQISEILNKKGVFNKSIEFKSLETQSYYFKLKWKENFFEKLGLFLNLISNNFGLSWQQGLVFTFSCAFIFFHLMMVGTECFVFRPWQFSPELIPAFLKFINPIRFFELKELFAGTGRFENIQLSPWSYIWDFVGKIFIVYGYYQTIQAFRRHGKK